MITYHWIPFEESREIVHQLGLKSKKEWQEYVKIKPYDLMPASPDDVYKNKGWISWGDFLGTGFVHKKDFLPFEEARTFVRTLGIENQKEWQLYATTHRPNNIPNTPPEVYKNEWIDWSDWLGIEYFRDRHERERLENEIQPTLSQENHLIGTMLGDGCLTKSKSSRNARLSICHSPAQMHYTDYYTTQLDFVSFSYSHRYRNGHTKRNGEKIIDTQVYSADSIAHSYFTKMHLKWYQKGKKIVPLDLKLNPEIIAFWYFDDGSLSVSTRSVVLCTNSFSVLEVEFLINQLKNLGITDCQLRYTRPNQPIIVIGSKSIRDFIKMITPFLPVNHSMYDELFYKIDLSKMTEPRFYCIRKYEINLIKELEESGHTCEEIMEITKLNIEQVKKIMKKVILNEHPGINIEPNGSYKVRITIAKEGRIYLGVYPTQSEAIKIREEALKMKERGIADKQSYIDLRQQYTI